ncbi:hypothetical protein [Vibrio methylphosphonaticus]|uniref:hypothetical protein n=1 Tax=Vibrio methylphosphonaticus TaxID=2946866 RepID=UPI00202A2623|nr:hypothetical protein [Vibrio methylphosphonaticus]MCL9775791.1 hypothetical protein [Vibrio methylphosphonaticus]
MLLERIAEIIELTDSDHLAQAMEIFNQNGSVLDEYLPFLNVVFEQAPELLVMRLSKLGFKGTIVITQVNGTEGFSGYMLYDAERITHKRTLAPVTNEAVVLPAE